MNTFRWDIKPKVIDSAKNESTKDSYVINLDYPTLIEQTYIIAADDVEAKTLPIPIGDIYAIELISDQPLDLELTGTSLTATMVTYNILINNGAGIDLTDGFGATIENNSGYIANVTWRIFGTTIAPEE